MAVILRRTVIFRARTVTIFMPIGEQRYPANASQRHNGEIFAGERKHRLLSRKSPKSINILFIEQKKFIFVD